MAIRANRPWRRLVSTAARPLLFRHDIASAAWTGPEVTIAVLSDFHAAWPHASAARLAAIARAVTALSPDLILLAGDFIAEDKVYWRRLEPNRLVAALSPLEAPLGVFAVLGNHDWADCDLAGATGRARNSVAEALDRSPVGLLMNRSVRLENGSGAFWLVGMDSQRPDPGNWRHGHHDPDAAFADVPQGAPALLLAHEPDYFARGDARATVQISGHTHAGQMNLFGWRPFVPSQFRSRYAHGLISEGGRHLVVSGGLGFTALPLRIGAPPEVTLVRVRPR